MLFKSNSHIDFVTFRLLKVLSVSITTSNVVAELEKHPNYPSFLAVTDVLDWYGIKNSSYKIPQDEILGIPAPFIIQTMRNGEFAIVEEITKSRVIVSDNQRGRQALSLSSFRNLYAGTAIVPDEITYQPIKRQLPYSIGHLRPYIIIGSILYIVILLLWEKIIFIGLDFAFWGLFIAKSFGLFTSILLLVQSIDTNNPFIQRMCKGGGKKDCNAILTSSAAKITGGLSWSELGFFYFFGTWLALLFYGPEPALFSLLFIINIISLPYTFYSIIYQKFIAKTWCVLCCTIQAILWLEFFFIPKILIFHNTVNEIMLLSACLLFSITVWLLIKPLLLHSQQLATLKSETLRFKYNKDLFDKTLQEQPRYNMPGDDWCIALGSLAAQHTITIVTNPYCPPCSDVHQEIDEWLDRYPDIAVKVVFSANNEDKDIRTPVARHFLALNEQNDRQLLKVALRDWYTQKQKRYETWSLQYPIVISDKHTELLQRQKNWCDLVDIKSTPTLFIDGYHLPSGYGLKDIKYMLK